MQGSMQRPLNRLQMAGMIALATVGIVIVLIFGLRAFRDFQRFRRGPPPMRTSDVELIRDWMTIGHIAHTYGVPPEELFTALGLDPSSSPRQSMRNLAKASGQDVNTMIATLKQVILQRQQSTPVKGAP